MPILRQYAPLTDFQQKRWFGCLKGDKNQVLFALMAERPSKTNFIGYCGITNIDFKNRRGEISFLVDPARVARKDVYRRDFLAALTMLCRYGFVELNLNRIFTETYDFRKEHIKILEEFGFKREGELRKHCFGGGRYFNSLIHSVLSSEWGSIKKIWSGKIKK